VAFDRAVASVLRQAVGDHGVSFGGKTDPQIALEIMSALSVPDEDARDNLPGVIQALEREMEAALEMLQREGRVLPGVLELLERLDRWPHVRQSVLTGNTEANARLKIGAFGLDGYLDLDIAAFGSDSPDRNQLVPIALEKCAQLRNRRIAPDDVWVIGDTALDLACARAAGARCLLVATGRVPFDELVSAGADATFHDLSEVDEIEHLLLAPADADA
jgi:phosphoglycolate phosphatase-like HAD superfamily hydrolase